MCAEKQWNICSHLTLLMPSSGHSKVPLWSKQCSHMEIFPSKRLGSISIGELLHFCQENASFLLDRESLKGNTRWDSREIWCYRENFVCLVMPRKQKFVLQLCLRYIKIHHGSSSHSCVFFLLKLPIRARRRQEKGRVLICQRRLSTGWKMKSQVFA